MIIKMMAPSRREKLGQLLEQKFNKVSEISDSDRAAHFRKSNGYEQALAGSPIDDAYLAVKGNMTHAGMVPVLAEVDGGGENGVYSIPFEWTMAGDWVVTVDIQLADGTKAQKRFDMAVQFEDEELCGEHEREQ